MLEHLDTRSPSSLISASRSALKRSPQTLTRTCWNPFCSHKSPRGRGVNCGSRFCTSASRAGGRHFKWEAKKDKKTGRSDEGCTQVTLHASQIVPSFSMSGGNIRPVQDFTLESTSISFFTRPRRPSRWCSWAAKGEEADKKNSGQSFTLSGTIYVMVTFLVWWLFQSSPRMMS